ncbi:MAG: RNA polymerase sigma factor [Acidimicrobiales bacterium]
MRSDGAAGASDAALIAESLRDVARFGEVYDRHIEAVLAFHFRRTGCAETAADLTAETFASAFASRRRFRDVGVPARAWLFTIARRQLSHYMRRQRVATRARRRLGTDRDVSLDDGDIDRIEALVDFGTVRRTLTEAIRGLPPGQADAVWLRIGQDMSYADVASRLACSEAAARVRVSRGLAHLTAVVGANQ